MSSFCSAKATHIFSAKNVRILYIESAKTVNEMTLKANDALNNWALPAILAFVSVCFVLKNPFLEFIYFQQPVICLVAA